MAVVTWSRQLHRPPCPFPSENKNQEDQGPTAKAIGEGGQLQISGTPQQEQVLWAPLWAAYGQSTRKIHAAITFHQNFPPVPFSFDRKTLAHSCVAVSINPDWIPSTTT